MPNVHPTAILEGDIDLADDVTIGPNCSLTGKISIGPGTTLIGNNYINGPLTMGANNVVYPFACLGFAAQDLKWDPNRDGAGLVIGDGNTFREKVTVHRATTDDAPTRIGNENYFMVVCHVGHDSNIGNNCIFANSTLVAGFATIGDRVLTGGHAAFHQFSRTGRGAFISGTAGALRDVPPFFTCTGIGICGSINIVGMRRSGMSSDDIAQVKWVFSTLYRRNLSLKGALNAIRERADNPLVAEYIEFLEGSQRGICRGRGDDRR
ncbi:MAG: acyl-ACP--UDP-N-acetylglucosamine O-acyltransferase [Planctomycetota bacterium]